MSRVAEAVGLSEPAASQGLTRLRLALGDVSFVRTGGRMRLTLHAVRPAAVVQPTISSIHEVTTVHFLALPAIIAPADLAVVMPAAIA